MTGIWQVEARDNPTFHAYRRLDPFILLATVTMLISHALRMRQSAEMPQEVSAET